MSSTKYMANGHQLAWIVLVVLICVGGVAYWLFPFARTGEAVLGWIGVAIAITHFLHQHELERNQFFRDLFKEFNERYDRMNDGLQVLRDQKQAFTSEQRALVVDYFNLCAEEYLFRQRGYIPDDVWRAWRNGMRWYAATPEIERIWKEERTTDSYYGFDLVDCASGGA